MKLDLDRTEHGRTELAVSIGLGMDWTEDRPAEAQVTGVLTVVNLDSRFLVNGTLRAEGKAPCGRCLEDFSLAWDVPVEIMVLRNIDSDEGEGDTLVLRQTRGEADLTEALRECVILAYPATTICREECLGICPHCGGDRNRKPCACEEEDTDPRWAALDALED